MIKRLWDGFVEDAPMIALAFMVTSLFTDLKQGVLFGAMLVWVIFEILDIQHDLSGKLKKLIEKFSK